MVDNSHASSSAAGSDISDPVSVETKPPAIRTMHNDLSGAGPGNSSKLASSSVPSEARKKAPAPRPPEIMKQPDTPKAKHIHIPEPPNVPTPKPPPVPKPTPPAPPSPPHIEPQGSSSAPKPPSPPAIPTPPVKSPAGADSTQKPVVPAMTASFKPLAPKRDEEDSILEDDPGDASQAGPALAPEELLATEETFFIGNDSPDELDDNNKKPKKKLPKKALLLGLVGIIFLVVLGGGGYYAYSQDMLSFLKKKPAPASNTQKPIVDSEQIPEPEPIPKPEPLLFSENIITTAVDTADDAAEQMLSFYENGIDETLTVIIFTDKLGAVIPLNDLALELGIVFPANILKRLDLQSYTVFLTNESSLEEARVGIVIRTADHLALSDSMVAWESSMIEDVKTFVYRFGGAPKDTTNEQFTTNLRQGISIRYVKFIDPTTGIAYAAVEDDGLLVIGTSRQNIFEALDAL